MRQLNFFFLFAFTLISITDALAQNDSIAIPEIAVPNVFTPNFDDYNDLLVVTHNDITSLTMKIYNRWGSEVHQFTGLNAGWDGKTSSGQECPMGTYFYVLNYVNPDGTPGELLGSTSLFR
jgi:gliding motility-associated-like protein